METSLVIDGVKFFSNAELSKLELEINNFFQQNVGHIEIVKKVLNTIHHVRDKSSLHHEVVIFYKNLKKKTRVLERIKLYKNHRSYLLGEENNLQKETNNFLRECVNISDVLVNAYENSAGNTAYIIAIFSKTL
jgi:hypothetical protein